MSEKTSRHGLHKPSFLGEHWQAELNENWETIDRMLTGTAARGSRMLVWFFPGTVAVESEQGPTFRLDRAYTAGDVTLHSKGMPTGTSLIIDINEGGASIFATRPEIDSGSTTEDNNHVFSDTALADEAEITCDVDQVGSVQPGTNLTVTLEMS